jgi:cytochrome P450
MLMLARDAETGEGMGRKQLRDEVMTFTAGYETTARARAWTFYLMDKYPQEARKLGGEFDEVLGRLIPTFDDLPRLPYTGVCSSRSPCGSTRQSGDCRDGLQETIA